VKQGDKFAAVLSIFAIHAAAESMNAKWRFHRQDSSVSSKNYMKKKRNTVSARWASTGPSMQTMLRLSFYREKSLI
jgi:hypothetical protein